MPLVSANEGALYTNVEIQQWKIAISPLQWRGGTTITRVARGWESKAIEAQQDEAAERNRPARARLTREEREHLQKIESLRLSLENVKQQLERTQQGRRRAVLERAKAELEERIQQLGAVTVKPAAGQ